jgi:hypothetical protein
MKWTENIALIWGEEEYIYGIGGKEKRRKTLRRPRRR